jgi:hypothetical protein
MPLFNKKKKKGKKIVSQNHDFISSWQGQLPWEQGVLVVAPCPFPLV